ncbi:hypothetical protein [Tabrizicola sp. BL-A-41-H6]|uniref:hypothetical protein n=1 Tax=Tabrizicola sp. BL-A-41-H6 TaxID=3421107 RepID=UPI003D67CF7C
MSGADLDPLDEAGKLLLFLAVSQARLAVQNPQENRVSQAEYQAALAQVRRLLADVSPAQDPHKFMAAKTALESLEAIERGEAMLGGMGPFRGFAEGVLGGPREVSFGGIKIARKPTAEEAFLKAALVVLWEKFPERRPELVKEARKHLGILNQKQVAKMVDNFNQRHDVDIAASRTPISIHIPLVTDLVTNHGYTCLSDFV